MGGQEEGVIAIGLTEKGRKVGLGSPEDAWEVFSVPGS